MCQSEEYCDDHGGCDYMNCGYDKCWLVASYCSEEYYYDDDWGGSGSGTGSGGGGQYGGGDGSGNPPDCGGGLQGRAYNPCGSGWEPFEEADDLDDQWQNNSLVDSSANPCVDSALATLKQISEKIPTAIRDYYDKSPSFNVTYKMSFQDTIMQNGYIIFPEVAWTTNSFGNNFITNMNSYYSGMSNLSYAITIIHEALHCQIINSIRMAGNDSIKKRELAEQYGFVFTSAFKNDSILYQIATQSTAQHNFMTAKYISVLAETLYEYAQAKGLNVTLNFCKDLAWMGMYDSKAWNVLSSIEQDRLADVIGAEQDPNNSHGLNANYAIPKGIPCN